MLSRYVWNVLLCEALDPSLNAFEITLRNRLHGAIEEVYPARELDCEDIVSWLDLTRSIIDPRKRSRTRKAKDPLRDRGADLTEGRLIAELNLNFWRKLLHKPC